MFKLAEIETLKHNFKVENHSGNVDSTLFLRFQNIDVDCYR